VEVFGRVLPAEAKAVQGLRAQRLRVDSDDPRLIADLDELLDLREHVLVVHVKDLRVNVSTYVLGEVSDDGVRSEILENSLGLCPPCWGRGRG
jgi:hypothetical protein